MDHDQRFKTMLKEFFPDFMRMFVPQMHDLFDFSNALWLEQEVFADPPHGERGAVDLVAQVKTRQPVTGGATHARDSMLALLHIEIEQANSVESFRIRMYRYYEQLRRRHNLPVLPIALYLRVGRDGIGVDVYEEYFGEHRALRFEYLYIGLPALNAEEYVHGNSWLGVALSALMQIEPQRKLWLATEGYNRLIECKENAWRRFLLGDCFAAYLALDNQQREELMQIMTTEPYKSTFPYTKTWFDEGLEQGLEQGLERGREQGVQQMLQMLQMQIETRFGPLGAKAQEQLKTMPTEQLMELARTLLTAQSLSALGLPND